MREQHEAAEAAGLGLQFLDRRDRVIGRADHRYVEVRVSLDKILAAQILRHDRELRDLVIIIDVVAEAEAAVADRLLAGLGEMDLDDQPPVPAINRLAMLAGDLLADRPVRRQRAERGFSQSLELQHADAMA